MYYNETRAFAAENYYLSNRYRCDFFVPGLGPVRSAEHAFSALKSDDPDEQNWVLAAESPHEAYRRGRVITLRPGWETGGRVSMMREVLRCKFQHVGLAAALYRTEPACLVEGNTHHDNFWGDCTCGRPSCAPIGLNMLGELLMAVRSELVCPDGLAQPRSEITSWNAMSDWLIDSLDDQPAGLVLNLGQSDFRDCADATCDPVDLSRPIVRPQTDVSAPAPVVCAQIHVLSDDVLLVRRSHVMLSDLRFLDHKSVGVVLDTWHHDDPFGDCTAGYLYTRDRRIAAQACINWFRDVPNAPHLDEIGCNYSFASELPRGDV